MVSVGPERVPPVRLLRPARAAIVGGGISGLALGYYLQRAGWDLTVLERRREPGGVIQSGLMQGYLCEWGPNSTFAQSDLLELISELKLEGRVRNMPTHARKRYLVTDANRGLELQAVPSRAVAGVRSPLLSLSAKLRMLGEAFAPRGGVDDESVESFMNRRIGAEATRRIADAVISGIWAADISDLSCRTALPKLWAVEREHGSLLRAALHRRKNPEASSTNHNARALLTFRDGLVALPRALQEALGPQALACETEVTKVEFTEDAVHIRAGTESLRRADVLAWCAQPQCAASVLPVPGELAQALQSISYAPLGIIHAAVPRSAVAIDSEAFGFLNPPIFSRGLLGVIFSSSLLPERAPEGMLLLTIFAGGARFPAMAEVTNSVVMGQIIADVSALLKSSERLQIISTRYLPAAIPNPKIGHYRLLERIAEFEAGEPRLRFFGNWMEGVSVADRVRLARIRAEEITKSMNGRLVPHAD